MTQSPAERLAQRHRTTRPMPMISVPREGEPAVAISRPARRSPKRPHIINTALSDEAHTLLEQITLHFRKQHGRSWRQNTTIEEALTVLARQLNIQT